MRRAGLDMARPESQENLGGHDRILNAKVRRAGYAVDTWLFYATGGAALARGKFTASGDYKGSEPDSRYIPLTTSDSQTHIGWTVGAGIEKAFTPNLIGRLEARYTDFGSKSYNLGNFGEDVKADWHQATVSVGLSYKF